MKRLFITFFGVSAYLIFYLVAGMAPDVTRPPPLLEATEAAPVGTQPSGFLAGGILTSMAGPSMAALIVSGLGDGPTWVVSCLGDSITEGVPYSGTENTYPARLQVMLDAAYGSGNFQVVNHGVGGHRADEVLDDLRDLNWMGEDNPDFVLLIVGGNDLYQGQTIVSTREEVQDIVNLVAAHTNPDGSHPKIIVSAMIPNLIEGPFGSWYILFYNSDLAANLTGVDLWFTDNWDDLYDPATGQAKQSLMSDDVHPNADGYAVIAENWFEAINSLLYHLYLPLILRDH